MANVDLEESVANLNAITIPEAFQDYEIQLPDISNDDDYFDDEEEMLTLNPIRRKEMISISQPDIPISMTDSQENSLPNLLLSQDDFLEIDTAREMEYFQEPDYLATPDLSRDDGIDLISELQPEILHEIDESIGPHDESMDIQESTSESVDLIIPEVYQRPKRKQPTLFDAETQLSSEFILKRQNNPDMFMREMDEPPTTKKAFLQRDRELTIPDEFFIIPNIDNLPEPLRKLYNSAVQTIATTGVDESFDVARAEHFSEATLESADHLSFEAPPIPHRDSELDGSLLDEHIAIGEHHDIPEISQEEAEEDYISDEHIRPFRPSEVEETMLSERSQRMLSYLRKEVTNNETIDFDHHFEGKSKRTVAISFWTLLEMKSKNYVDLQQDEPYGNIEVTLL